MDNREMAQVFERIADLLAIKGESVYRINAYRRAADALSELGQDVEDLWREGRLREIPGVGEAIAGKIDELLRTGKLEFYERLTREVPESLLEVLQVEDVGPKRAAHFWKELGITTVDELEAAARAGKLRELPGLGERSEARILESIAALRRRQTERVPIGHAWPVAESFLERLRAVAGVTAAEAAGSLRRWRETVGDLDLIVGSEDPSPAIEAFLATPGIRRVRSRGETKVSVEMRDGLRVQLWVHPPERFGSALQYATGSKAHNVRLRELALDRGLSLSEHGFRREDGGEILCREEEAVYAELGLPWIPPELREDRGEIRAALAGALPRLVRMEDLKGEFHAHSDWTDGACSLLEMAEVARQVGLQYLAITDHTQSLGVANGLTVERLRKQRRAVEALQAELGTGLRLLHGAEVEILADGSLDYPDEVLAELDLVIAALHTSLRQTQARVTERLLAAIHNPHVDMIAHPTGRLIGSRDGANLDMEVVLKAAAEAGVALEINANPERLDLNDVHARRAIELGCLLAINTDAHRPEHLGYRRYGVGVARRAWAPAERVINTWDVDRVIDWLQRRG